MYDHPPPEDVAEAIGAIRLADADSVFAGAGPLLKDATRLRDAAGRFFEQLLP